MSNFLNNFCFHFQSLFVSKHRRWYHKNIEMIYLYLIWMCAKIMVASAHRCFLCTFKRFWCVYTLALLEIFIKEMVNENQPKKSVDEIDDKVLHHRTFINKIEEFKTLTSHLTGRNFDNLWWKNFLLQINIKNFEVLF